MPYDTKGFWQDDSDEDALNHEVEVMMGEYNPIVVIYPYDDILNYVIKEEK